MNMGLNVLSCFYVSVLELQTYGNTHCRNKNILWNSSVGYVFK